MSAARLSLAALLAALLLGSGAPANAQGASADELGALERRAEDRFALDDLAGATALYRQLAERVKTPQEKTRVRMYVAYLEHLQQNDPAAIATVRDALVEDPGYVFRPELYNESFTAVFYQGQKLAVDQRERLAEDAVKLGNERLSARDYAGARRHYETALAHRSDHSGALYNLALTDLYDQRQEAAEAGFQKLLALGDAIEPRLRALALTNLGYLYERRQQYSEAQAFLEDAVALDPANSRAWSILGVARRQTDQQKAAAQAFRRAYELAPEDAEAMSHLALAYLDARDWDNAVALLEKATAAEPGNANHWLQLGLAREGLGQGEEAVAAFEAAIRLDPNDAAGRASDAATQLALYYYEAQDPQRALGYADRALAWRPGLVTARIFQGLARESLGDLSGARESLEEARRLDPARAAIHNNLGSVYYQLGLWDQATEAFERALAIQPDFPGARANLEAVRQARSLPRTPAPAATRAPATPRRSGDAGTRTARLGIRFADIDYAALGLSGAMVESVEAGSPAARAGLRKNDLVLKVDGRGVANVEELERDVAGREIGSTVTLSLLRADVLLQLEVRLD